MTSWSFASSGGGGEGRAACSPVGLVASTPPGYDGGPNRDVLSPRARPADEGNR
jgi:hypothetical protein